MSINLKLKNNNQFSIDNIFDIDYIIASGACNIAFTGDLTNNNPYNRIELDIEVISNTIADSYIFKGNSTSGSGYNFLQCSDTTATNFKWAWATGASASNTISFSGRKKISIYRKNATYSEIKINEEVTTSTFTFGGSNYYSKYYLLPSDGITIKIWSIKFYTGVTASNNTGTLYRNLIPKISNEPLHCGEATLYDTVNNTFYYPSSNGSFLVDQKNVSSKITTAYVKDCPNVSGLNILRTCPNLTRVRLNIGNVTGSLQELLSYSTLGGFNDNYEEQTKPRLVGTWTINWYYTNAMLVEAQAAFDGLTIVENNSYNWDYLLDNNQIAVQTIDSTKANYNPAFAIWCEATKSNKGIRLNAPLVNGGGTYFITVADAATFDTNTSAVNFFHSIISRSDTKGIVDPNNINATYNVTSLREFIYFTCYTNTSGCAYNSTNLLEIWFPPTIISGGISYNKYGIVRLTANSVLTDVSTTNPTNFIVGNSYEKDIDKTLFESYLNSAFPTAGKSKLCTWYDWITPKISYDGSDVSITVLRPSTIYYTTDGNTPTTESTQYAGTFSWDGVGVVKAIAVEETTNNLEWKIAYSEPYYVNSVEDPVITYTSTMITISCSTSNATIYYTADGSYPLNTSLIYDGPIAVSGDIVKIRCFATKEGMNDSNVVGKICVLDDTLWGTDGDTSTFAIQTIDNTKPNYNPAVAIILNNYFNYKTDVCYGGSGYYFTKTDAAAKTNIGTNYSNAYFGEKTTVTDICGIITIDKTATYDFTTFNEFKYFTGVTSLPNCANTVTLNGGGAFTRCTKLQSIILPSTLTTLGTGAFGACTALNCDLTIPSGVTVIPTACFSWSGCIVIIHDGITTFKAGAFSASNGTTILYPTINRFPSYLTTLESQSWTHIYKNDYTLPATCVNVHYGRAFKGNSSIGNAVHWLPEILSDASFTNIGNRLVYFFESVSKVYVGDGSSAEHDNAILEAYKTKFTNAHTADGGSATNSGFVATLNKLDTWYNYLHFQ